VLSISLWTVAGLTGGVLFWLVQTLTGGPTITAFMGEQLVAAGGYPPRLTTLLGWAVHMGVSLAYALLFAVLLSLLSSLAFSVRVAVSFALAVGLGGVTAVIAPPAISVAIGLLGRHGWPDELYPLNTELGLPFWNHLLFFLVNWAIQAAGPRLLGRHPRRTEF